MAGVPSFPTIVREAKEQMRYTAKTLAEKSGVAVGTIKTWLIEGKVAKPRWRDILRVAQALELSRQATDGLLTKTGHPSLTQLRTSAITPDDLALFFFWDRPHKAPQVIDPDLLRHAQQTFQALPLKDVPKPKQLPAGSRLLKRAKPLFIGRKELLRSLARILKERKRCVILSGIAGLGKTLIAHEFANHYGQYFVGGVFWLSFANPDQIDTEIGLCGEPQHMNLFAATDPLTLAEKRDRVLQAWQHPLPRLVVLDNCEDAALLRYWLAKLSECYILVTSRCAMWDADMPIHVEAIPVLEPKDSLHLLQELSRPYWSEATKELQDLAAALHHVPLTLQVAGRYLRLYHQIVTPKHYLAQLREVKLHQHPSIHDSLVKPDDYHSFLMPSLQLSYDRLRDTNPTDTLGRQILSYQAQLAPGIWAKRTLLQELLEIDRTNTDQCVHFEEAITRLVGLGLLEDAGEVLRLHRLIADFIDDETRTQEPVRVRVAEAFLQRTQTGNETREVVDIRESQAHLQHVADRAVARAAHLCKELGEHFWLLSDSAGAHRYLNRALAIYHANPDTHPHRIAEVYNVLGLAFQNDCHYHEAQHAFEQALAIWHTTTDRYDPRLADDNNNLGYLLLITGNHQKADEYLHAALAIWRHLFHHARVTATPPLTQEKSHETDPVTATLQHAEKGIARELNNLGYLALKRGRYRRARRYLRAALHIRERVYSENDVSMAITISHLGEVAYALEDYTLARERYETALSMRNTWFQGDNTGGAESLYLLGQLCCSQGMLDQAEAYFCQAQTITETILGYQDRQMGFIMHGFGVLYYKQALYQEALHHFNEALQIRQHIYGLHHQEVATTWHAIGMVQAAVDDLDASESIQQAFAIRESILDPDHPDIAESLFALGTTAIGGDSLQKRYVYLDRSRTIYTKRLGVTHSKTRTVWEAIAQLEQDQTAVSSIEAVLPPL